jgi:hypothetical protein
MLAIKEFSSRQSAAVQTGNGVQPLLHLFDFRTPFHREARHLVVDQNEHSLLRPRPSQRLPRPNAASEPIN